MLRNVYTVCLVKFADGKQNDSRYNVLAPIEEQNSMKRGVRVLVCIFNQGWGKHISDQTKRNSGL